MSNSAIVSVIAGMAVFLLLHLVIWRQRPSHTPRILLLGLLAGVGIAVSWVISLSFSGFNGFELCAVLWTDLFVILSYMFVYAGIARSVSITLLSRLHRCGDQPLDFDVFVDEYIRSSRFEDRIRLMCQSGLVHLSGDSVTLTRKGFMLARAVKGLGQVIGEGLRG